MKAYWSNTLNCVICGFTNRWFWSRKYNYHGEIRYYKSKKCVECFKELRQNYLRKYQRSEKFRQWRRQYIAKNRKHINELNRVHRLHSYIRKCDKKRFERLKQEKTGANLK